jgi:hypothetical protein
MTTTPPPKASSKGKLTAVCSKCKSEIDSRLHRSWLIKTIFFWLPVRKFWCYKCKKSQYAIINR